MFEDFYEVDSQHGLLEIDLSKYIGMDVGQDIFKINVTNNLLSPTNQVVVIFKGNNDIKKFNAEITLFGSRAEIMIFTESDLDFAKLDVKEFERVLFGDLNFIKDSAFAFPDGSYKNLKYNIDLLYARSAFLFGNNITIGGGEIKELLQLSTHGEKGSVKIKGISAKELFNIKKVKFSPDCLMEELSLTNIRIGGGDLLIKAIDSISLRNISLQVGKLKIEANKIDLSRVFSTGSSTEFSSSELKLNILNLPSSVIIINTTNINFLCKFDGTLKGYDLIIDLPNTGKNSKFIFVNKFEFANRIYIKTQSSLQFNISTSALEVYLENPVSVSAYNIQAKNFTYKVYEGYISLVNAIIENALFDGNIVLTVSDSIIKILEMQGLKKASLSIHGNFSSELIKINVHADSKNIKGDYGDGNLDNISIIIGGTEGSIIKIKTIAAVFNSLFITRGLEVENFIIIPAQKMITHYKIDPYSGKFKVHNFFILSSYSFTVNPGGVITLNSDTNVLGSSDINLSSGKTEISNRLVVSSGKGIRFDGGIQIVDRTEIEQCLISLFADGPIYARGTLTDPTRKTEIIISSVNDSVDVMSLKAEAKSIVIHSGKNVSLSDSTIEALKILIYAADSYIQVDSSIKSKSIVLVAEREINIISSKVDTEEMIAISNKTIIDETRIIGAELSMIALKDFIMGRSNIDINNVHKVIFTNEDGSFSPDGQPLRKLGVQLQWDEISVIGIISPDRSQFEVIPKCQKINSKVLSESKLQELSQNRGNLYLDVGKGLIIGSTIDSNSKVIIRSRDNFDLVNLNVYNALMEAGGFHPDSVRKVISQINAGYIEVDVGSAFTSIDSILRATHLDLAAGYVHVYETPDPLKLKHLFESMDRLKINQDRMKHLRNWFFGIESFEAESKKADFEFSFSSAKDMGGMVGQSLSISEKVKITNRYGKVDVYYDHSASKVELIQESGDIKIDRSVDYSKQNYMAISAKAGRILIHTNPVDFMPIEDQKQTIFKGNNVHLEANILEMRGAKTEISGKMRVVTKDGVHILPVSVYNRIYHYSTSSSGIIFKETTTKTTIEETVQHIVSEINAGLLEIESGKEFEAISAILNIAGDATIKSDKFHIGKVSDILEKRAYWSAKNSFMGITTSSESERSETKFDKVIESKINAGGKLTLINKETTIEAAKIVAKDFKIECEGDINILNGYNIHLHQQETNKYSLMSFSDGGLTLFGNRSISDFVDGKYVVPSIICVSGSFYGISKGNLTLLGTKIIGKEIYLSAEKNIKLESPPEYENKVTFISESGMRVGFSADKAKSSVSFGASIFETTEREEIQAKLYNPENALLDADKISVIARNGTFSILSGQVNFKEMNVEAKDWEVKFLDNELMHEIVRTHKETGLKIEVSENISKLFTKTEKLLDKKGSHIIDNADRVAKTYDLYKSLSSLKNGDSKVISSGVYFYGKSSQDSNRSYNRVAVDSILTGGKVFARIENDVRFEGAQFDIEEFDVEAKNFSYIASSNQSTTDTSHVDTEFQIALPMPGQMTQAGVKLVKSVKESSLHASKNDSHSSDKIYNENNLKVKGKLSLKLRGDGRIVGASFIGGQVEVRAKNLIVESVQDEASYSSKGFNLGFSIEEKSLSGGSVGGDVAEYNKRVTKQIAKIIGEQGTNIAISGALEVAASIIASAKENEDGTLSETGQAQINAARMVIKTLHDYDDGYSMGLGVHYQVQGKEAKQRFNVDSMDVKLDYKDRSSEIVSYVGGMKGEGLSSDINSLRINEKAEEFGFDATIYPGDIKDGLKALGGNNQAGAKEIIEEQEELEIMELEEIENEAILENKAGLPGHQKVSRNDESGDDDSDEDEYTESFLDHAKRGKYIDDNQYNDIFRQINLMDSSSLDKESYLGNILTDKEEEELEKTIRSSIKSEKDREEQRKIMQYASIGNPDLAYDHLVALEAPPMTLKEQAAILQKGASIYNSFAEDHPIIAEYGTSATLLAAKTLVAGAAGAIEHLIVEVRGRVIGSMLGLDAAINGSINQAAKIFKKIDISLSDEESHTLAAAYILGPIMLAGSAQDIKFATSKIAGKLKFQDKVKIENEFEKTGSLDRFFSKTIDKSGAGSLTKFGKTDIDLGSKFKFKGLEIDVVKGLDEIKIPVTKDATNSVAIAMHDKYGKFFRDENLGMLDGKRLFWSKDQGKHAGSGYKLFIEKGTEFELIANIAPDGKIIQNKHQSGKSKKIEKKEFSWIKNSRE